MRKEQQKPASLWIVAAIAGGLATGVSLLLILLTLILPKESDSPVPVILVSVGVIALTLGIGLLSAGLSGMRHLSSPTCYTKWGWLVFLALTVGLILVTLPVPGDWQKRPLFAPIHLGMAAMPAFLLLSLATLAAGRQRTLSLREFIVTASGGAMTTLLALPVEIIGFVISAIIVIIAALVIPGGAAEVEHLSTVLEQWAVTPPAQAEEVLTTIATPVALATLALTLAVIAPLIEELGKTLVMGVMGIWKRPGLTRAFLWGAACGLGFAIVEGVSNGAGGLGEVAGWLGGMGARALATSMHMLTSGVIGLGWGFFWRKRRWALPLAYVGAVTFHGLWNFNIIAIIGGIGVGLQASPLGFAVAVAGVGMASILVLFAPLALIIIPLLLRRYLPESG